MATASASSRAATAPQRRSSITPSVGLAAITVAALVLRLATLGEQSYWLDESYTVHLVRLGLGSMLSTIPRTESTPPLYYVLAWVWTHGFGSGEWGLRSLSALAGTGCVWVGGLIGRRLAGPRAGLIAAALLAVNPLLVWFSQEARAYALATLLTAVALLLLLRYAEDGRRGDLAGWALASALALCTHYFTAFVILPGAVWLILNHRRSIAVRAGLGLVAAVTIALVPLALAQRGTGHADYIAHASLGTRLIQIPKQLLIGYASPGQILTAIVATALLLGGLLPWWRGRRGWPRTAATLLIVAAALAGIGLPIVLALLGGDFIDTRNLLATLPPLVALVAAGLSVPARSRLGPCCAAGLVIVSLITAVRVDADPGYQRIDWRGAVQALGPVSTPRVVLISPASALLPVRAYVPDTRVLTGTLVVRELDYVDIPGGTTPLPTPRPITISPPPGFVRVAGGVGTGYSFVRFRSAVPVAVTQAELDAAPLGHDRTTLVQTPG